MAKKKKDKKKLGILGKIILTLFIILTCLFIYYLLKLQVLPIKMFTIILIGLLLANLITFLILRFSKRKIFNIIPILGCAGLFYGVYSLANTNDMLTNMNVNYKTSNYALIVKKESKYQKLEDLENKEISYLADDKDMLKKIKIKYTSKEYDDATKMAMDLLNDNTDSIILEQSYIDLLNDSEGSIKNFSDKVKIIYTFEVNTKVTELVKNVNTTKESFVIYLSGIDTYGPVSSVSRTDANMLVVVNPSSKQILLVSIPRDYYVDLAGKNGKDKFTHSGIYGIDTSVKTLEQLFGIDINYYFKINFSSLIKIVDSIGGVDVYSKYTFTSKDGYNYTSGYNHVNGKEALSFTRERKSFAAGDRVRNMNQQAMFEAILRKCTSKSILTKYNSLLNSLKSSFITNMPSNSLTSLIKKQLNDGTKWNVSSIALDGFNGSEYTYSYKGERLYVMIPDKKTVDAAKEKINEVFDGKVLESSYNDTVTNIKTVTKTEKKTKVVVTSNKVSNKVSNKKSNIKKAKKSNTNSNVINKKKKISNKTKEKKEKNLYSNKQNYVEKKKIDKIPVFTFHRLVPNNIKEKYFKNNQWVSSVEKFEEMMKYLHNNHYKTISTLEFYEWYIGNIEYNEKVVLITFDDGYIEDYALAYPILKKYNLKSTSFIIGSKVKPTTPEYNFSEEDYSKNPQIFMGQDIMNKVKVEYPNFDFQSHSYNLHSKILLDDHTRVEKVYTLTEEELDNDVKQSLKFGFKTMAYPFGAYNTVIQKKLKDNGYLLAFTFGGKTYGYATRKSNQYAINRIKIDGKDNLRSFVKWLSY